MLKGAEEAELRSAWDWTPGKRHVADLRQRAGDFEWREEHQVSPDGENIAAVVKLGETSTVCVSGDFWYLEFEKIWNVRYSPDGRLTALVMTEDEWTVAVDERLWPEAYAYLWDTRFSADGRVIAVAVQQDMRYGMIQDGTIWNHLFDNATGFAMSRDGSATAAVVQTVPFGQADIFTYQKGCYTVAVNSVAWDQNFVNAWSPVFSPDGNRVAAQVRTSLFDYTIAVDGTLWPRIFTNVWEPCFDPEGSTVIAPVRTKSGWGLARDGELFWKPRFHQLWGQQCHGSSIYAIVAPRFGHWAVAKDGVPWKDHRAEALSDLRVSPDGSRAAVRAKVKNQWTLCIDGTFWDETADMIWQPVFSPDGSQVATKVEKGGRYTVALDQRHYREEFDNLWEPVFSPEGDRILIRGVKDENYYRIVAPVDDFI